MSPRPSPIVSAPTAPRRPDPAGVGVAEARAYRVRCDRGNDGVPREPKLRRPRAVTVTDDARADRGSWEASGSGLAERENEDSQGGDRVGRSSATCKKHRPNSAVTALQRARRVDRGSRRGFVRYPLGGVPPLCRLTAWRIGHSDGIDQRPRRSPPPGHAARPSRPGRWRASSAAPGGSGAAALSRHVQRRCKGCPVASDPHANPAPSEFADLRCVHAGRRIGHAPAVDCAGASNGGDRRAAATQHSNDLPSNECAQLFWPLS